MPRAAVAKETDSLMIGEVASLLGVSASTLRAWEAAGLTFPERDQHGRRRFSATETARLREIKRLLEEEQFSLSALRHSWLVSDGADGARPAAGQADLRIASRLRTLRLRLNLTLRQVAERTGISPSYISQVENGLTRPSVACLQKLTQTYGITVLSLYETLDQRPPRLVRRGSGGTIEMGDPGVGVTLLSPIDAGIELHLFSLSPGAGSGGAYRHEGDEFMYVLEGRLGVWLDETEYYELEPGDCLSFPSPIEHRWINLAEAVTVFLGGNTPSTF
jgi:transcriptional regulator with XRE-family HTH domain